MNKDIRLANELKKAIQEIPETGALNGWVIKVEGLLTLLEEPKKNVYLHEFRSSARHRGQITQFNTIEKRNSLKGIIQSVINLLELNEMIPTTVNMNAPFIDPALITQLEELKANKTFQIPRLIKVCEEINSSYQHKNYISVNLLLRGLCDMIPPVFDAKNFSEIANNIASRSQKKSLTHLNDTMRSSADSNIHVHLSQNIPIPNANQVEYRSDIDLLLNQVIERLKQ